MPDIKKDIEIDLDAAQKSEYGRRLAAALDNISRQVQEKNNLLAFLKKAEQGYLKAVRDEIISNKSGDLF